jgi:hypothetical protein
MSIDIFLPISLLCSIGTCYFCYKIYKYLDEDINNDEFAQMFDEYKRDIDSYYNNY